MNRLYQKFKLLDKCIRMVFISSTQNKTKAVVSFIGECRLQSTAVAAQC